MLTTSYPSAENPNRGIFVYNLVKALDKRGVRSAVLCPVGYNALLGGAGILPNLKRSIKAKLQFFLYNLHMSFLIIKGAKQNDLIHANWGLTAFLALVTKPFHMKKVILTERSSQLLFTKNSLLKLILGFVYRNVDRMVVISNSSKEYLESTHRIGDVVVIRNGVDIKKIANKSLLRKELKILSNSKIVLTVGRLTYLKGIDCIIKGFSKIKRKDCFLFIIGSGEEENNLKRLVEKSGLGGRVLFLGNLSTEDVNDYMAIADVFIFASIMETGGNVLLEAVASGLPIITTRVGWAEDVVRDKVNGLFIEKDNVEDIRNKLNYILSTRTLRRFKFSARQAARSKIFYWGHCAFLYGKEYKSLLN